MWWMIEGLVNCIAFVRRVGFLVLHVVVVEPVVNAWVVSLAVLWVGVVLVVVVERVGPRTIVLLVGVVLVVVGCCDPMRRRSLFLALVVL